MISRRAVLASGAAALVIPAVARADTGRVTLRGTMEQGSLIVGKTASGARVTFDGQDLSVSPAGYFACGLDWDRTAPARIAVQLSGVGAPDIQIITPVARQYNVQHVNGLPPKTVSPPPADLARIK